MADLIFICFFVLSIYLGYKKGFIRTVVGFSSTLISLLITNLLYPVFSKFLFSIGVGELIKEIVLNTIDDKTSTFYSEGLSEATTVIIVNIISFILVIFLTKFILSILSRSLNIIGRLPVIKQANAILGMAIGLFNALLISYIVIGIIGALSGNESVFSLQQHIRTSMFPSLMYGDNAITKLLLKLTS